MKTAQIFTATNVVFATVDPPLLNATPPPGVYFVDYDEISLPKVLGGTYNPVTQTFTQVP